MIISNQARCHACGGEPFSTHRHDFASCECGNIAVDGGTSYLRRVMATGASYTNLSIVISNEAFSDIRTKLDDALNENVFDKKSMASLTLALLKEWGIRPVETAAVDAVVISRAALEGTTWAMDTGRNGFGLLSAVMRHVRDAGTHWEGEGMEDA